MYLNYLLFFFFLWTRKYGLRYGSTKANLLELEDGGLAGYVGGFCNIVSACK